MSRSFLDPHLTPSEPSATLAFAGNRLDRLSEVRAADCLEQALADSTCKAIGFARGRVLILTRNDGPQALFSPEVLNEFGPKTDRAVLLGYDDGAPRIAMPLSVELPDPNAFENAAVALPEGWEAVDFRSLARRELLSGAELGQIAQGGALLAWHGTSRFCARCGGPTEMRDGGAKRHCTACERDHFPRTDAVVIMLTISGDKCLLGRSHHFPPGMYSALAGFVEAGESIEMAVRRETFEEAGIRLGKVNYHASQPWPFPHTLMIGCYGKALEETVEIDGLELDDCRWFSRAEVLAIMAGEGERDEEGEPRYFMPPPLAIAHRLVSDWAHGRV